MAIDGVGIYDGNRQRRSADNPADGDLLRVDATGGNLVRIAIGADGSYLASDGSNPVWRVFLQSKAGRVVAASFTGNPKKATVTFSTAFADANYAVVVTAVTSNGKTFAPNVENQIAGSFDINLGTNNKTDLVQVNWVAKKDGETT